jgi:pSer/pThr/pTyr-binding forkhead associated (FHA) protein
MVSLDWILLGLRILTTIILYAFLGVAFYLIWRDLKQMAPAQDQYPISHRLRVIAPTTEQIVTINETLPLQPVTLLGRDPDNTIILNDMSASGRHARLVQENGIWWLEDLGSRNGTMLNDLKLAKSTPLAEGDIIGIGALRLRLEPAE